MITSTDWKTSRAARAPIIILVSGAAVIFLAFPVAVGVRWAVDGHLFGNTVLWTASALMGAGLLIQLLGHALRIRARARVRAMDGLCCPRCDYDLRTLRKDIVLCPKCGLAIDLHNMHAAWGGWFATKTIIKKYPRIRDDFLDRSARSVSTHSDAKNIPVEKRLP